MSGRWETLIWLASTRSQIPPHCLSARTRFGDANNDMPFARQWLLNGMYLSRDREARQGGAHLISAAAEGTPYQGYAVSTLPA